MRRLRNQAARLQGFPDLGLGALLPSLCQLKDKQLLGVVAENLLIPWEDCPLPFKEVFLDKVGVVDPLADT